MHRRLTIGGLAALGLALFLFFTPTGRVVSQNVMRVVVTNFPAVQTVEGEVTIGNPVRLSRLISFEDITVPPVQPSDTTRLVEAGVLETEGFPSVVLSLHGTVKGDVKTVTANLFAYLTN